MKTNQLKKLGLAIISAVMMFSSALGNLGIVSAKEVKYSISVFVCGFLCVCGCFVVFFWFFVVF